MLGSARAEALSYSVVKLFSKYSNLCEKHASTSRTDGQTDGRTDEFEGENSLHTYALLLKDILTRRKFTDRQKFMGLLPWLDDITEWTRIPTGKCTAMATNKNQWKALLHESMVPDPQNGSRQGKAK